MRFRPVTVCAINVPYASIPYELTKSFLFSTNLRVDQACLTPVLSLTPAAIRRIREREALSQAVFAAHLNVTTGVVSKWERGEKRPRGPAAKLLSLAAKHGIASIA